MIGAAYIGSQRANSRLLLGTTLFTNNLDNVYTVPAGTVYIEVDMYGGGGGGQNGFYQPAGGGRGGQPAVISGGGGGGGGARCRHRYSSNLASGDLIYFNISNGGAVTANAAGTSLNSHLRGVTTILNFSPAPVAGGGFGGGSGTGAGGGSATNGNLSNQNGNNGVGGTSSATVAQDGKDGGNPASGGGTTKGLGGLHATNTPPTAGTQPGGGGGGGYAKSGASYGGAVGGKGQLEMKAYG